MTDERTKTVGMATNDEDRDWRDSMAELIEILEHAWGLVIHLPDELEGEKANKAIEAIYDLLLAAREKALWRLARCGGLIGTELCDEFAEVTGTVTDVGCGGSVPLIVYRCPPGSEYPGGSEYLKDIGGESFFRVPGSTAIYTHAIVELLRQPQKANQHYAVN